jgi:hypothetical protein
LPEVLGPRSVIGAYRDAWVTHEPRCSRIGPSLTFAIIAAQSRSTENANATKSRHMPPSLFRIQRLFIIAGYLVHMTAQGSRSAIKGLAERNGERALEPTATSGSPSGRGLCTSKRPRPGTDGSYQPAPPANIAASITMTATRTTKATVRLPRATSWVSSMGPRPATSSP